MPRPNFYFPIESLSPLLKLPLHLTDLKDSHKNKNQNTTILIPKHQSALAPDIWKRLFPARTRRPLPIIPQIGITRRFSPRMEINLFKLCSGLRVLGYVMILLVAAIIGVSYYAVVLLTCGPRLLRGGFHSFLSFAIIIKFHVLLILLLWSYFRVVFKDPGSVPENWRAVSAEENLEVGTSLPAADDGFERRSRGGGYCIHCQNGKPPRCHHCSICRRCVLKMDHHCVWVVNCVGACNYKFFLLFLVYTFLETTLDTVVLLPSFINFFAEAKNHSSSPANLAIIFLAFVLNLAFALSLLCFLVMHASLLSSNTTSVEVHEKKGAARWKYDLGRKKNFEQVFGTKKSLWFLPLISEDDLDNIPALHGLDFPTRSDVEA